MALVLVPDCTRLVAHMSFGAEVWSNSIIIKNTSPGTLAGGETVITDFRDFVKGNTQNNAFVETITGYEVFQHHEGDPEVDHVPLFQNTYHINGTHDTAYNGPPGGDPLPKDVCIFAHLATSGGRSGKLFIRDCIDEGDVVSVQQGAWAFNALSGRFTVARFATLVSATLAHNFVGGSDAANHLIVVGHLLNVKAADARAPFVTPVTSCTAIRPVWNKARR